MRLFWQQFGGAVAGAMVGGAVGIPLAFTLIPTGGEMLAGLQTLFLAFLFGGPVGASCGALVGLRFVARRTHGKKKPMGATLLALILGAIVGCWADFQLGWCVVMLLLQARSTG